MKTNFTGETPCSTHKKKKATRNRQQESKNVFFTHNIPAIFPRIDLVGTDDGFVDPMGRKDALFSNESVHRRTSLSRS